MDLIRFSSKAGASVTLQREYAEDFIRMMGHQVVYPGAVLAEDVGKALQALRLALSAANLSDAEPQEEDRDDDKVSLPTRAFTLLQLLQAATEKQHDVLWDRYSGNYV